MGGCLKIQLWRYFGSLFKKSVTDVLRRVPYIYYPTKLSPQFIYRRLTDQRINIITFQAYKMDWRIFEVEE